MKTKKTAMVVAEDFLERGLAEGHITKSEIRKLISEITAGNLAIYVVPLNAVAYAEPGEDRARAINLYFKSGGNVEPWDYSAWLEEVQS